MATYVSNCEGCQNLQTLLSEKEEEIKKLELQIQNLTTLLQRHQIKPKCQSCCGVDENRGISKIKTVSCSEPEDIDTHSPNVFSPLQDVSQISDGAKDSSVTGCTEFCDCGSSAANSSPCKKADAESDNSACKSLSENLNHCSDYIYDENSKMYFSVSTGYYYDVNTELFYVPQTGSYYKYDYSKRRYELYENNKQICDSNMTDACDSVLDKVDNLSINDDEKCGDRPDEQTPEKTNGHVCYSMNSPVRENYTININLSSKGIELKSVKTGSESPIDAAKDWQPPEGSNTTVKDLVTEVAEQSSGMSDYIYDEKSSMYYCKSNGYYYDPIKKLLYDPRSEVYYLYIQETLSYEFYCKADAISNVFNKDICSEYQKRPQKETNKVQARNKFWKKKQKNSPHGVDEVVSSSEKVDIFEEDASTMNDGFSSPEAGEIFSSDSESEVMKENQITSTEEESPQPPCIRAIVEYSSKLKVGSLILITCTGAVIGRENFNTVHVPDVGVSKVHAEITFNNESWKYSIEDLGSQNGTFVNEVRLSESKQKSKPQTLSHGDKLALGSCKLLIHIHDGYETCDKCEPGQVMAELSSKEAKPVLVLKTKKEKEKERRQEMRRLKKKYGLKGMEYCDGKNYVPLTESEYEDKAEIRRKTVGSENPYEKTETASVDTFISEFNKGYQMLKKLGWKDGDSLGLTNSGISEPVPIRPWVSKAGLGCTDIVATSESLPEDKRKRKWVKAQERYFQISS